MTTAPIPYDRKACRACFSRAAINFRNDLGTEKFGTGLWPLLRRYGLNASTANSPFGDVFFTACPASARRGQSD